MTRMPRGLWLVLLGACGGSQGSVPAPVIDGEGAKEWIARSPVARIEVEYRPYFMGGGRDLYRIELRASGEATLFGRPGGTEWGDYVGRIHALDYARLCWLIERERILELNGEYVRPRTHQSDTTLVLWTEDGGELHRVHDYGDLAPASFWVFRGAVESVMARIRWTPTEGGEGDGD